MSGAQIVRRISHQPAGDPGDQVQVPALLRALAPFQQREGAILGVADELAALFCRPVDLVPTPPSWRGSRWRPGISTATGSGVTPDS